MSAGPTGSRQILPESFYRREDVTRVAIDLLGKVLLTRIDGVITSGRITETEAYAGRGDRACHAADGRLTPRNRTMHGPGGHAYVYLCYGIHALFNVVTHREGMPDAVLIRAVEPLEGLDHQMRRRGFERPAPELTAGPGRLTRALGIDTLHDGASLFSRLETSPIHLLDDGFGVPADRILRGPRVGVAYAGRDALRPWRFCIAQSRWVSRPRLRPARH